MMDSWSHKLMNNCEWVLHGLLCHGRPMGAEPTQQRHHSPLSDPRSGKPGWDFLSRRGLNFGDFVRKATTSCFFPPSHCWGQLSRILTFSNNGKAAVLNTDLQPDGVMGLIKFICAIVTRALFLLVSLIGVWRVKRVKEDVNYWFLTFLFLPLLVEMMITLKRRKGKDYKW